MHHLPKKNLYATYQPIPLWLGCAMHPNCCCFACYFYLWHCVQPHQYPQENNFGSLETNATYHTIVIQSLSAYYRKFYWTETLCLLCKLLGFGHLYKHSSTFSYVNAEKKHLFRSLIGRYVTFHHRNSLTPTCKVCSKLSWSCMGPLGRTMLTAPLRWCWEEDEAGEWILPWTTTPEVNVVCIGLTKYNCKRAVPVTVAATKPHWNKQSSVHICWPV